MAEPMSELERAVRRFREQLLAQEADTMRSIGRQYQGLETRLLDRLDRMDAVLADAGEPSFAQTVAVKRLEALASQASEELRRANDRIATTVKTQQESSIIAGAADAEALMGMEVRTRIDAISAQQLLAVLEAGSPVAELFQHLSDTAQASIRQTLFEAVATGQNSRAIAPSIRALMDTSAARALTIARTETLRAYRSGTLLEYQANDDLFAGWTWISAHDARTCAYCWSMHGTQHGLDESMATHPNCRCSMAPLARTAAPDQRSRIVPGDELFAGLPPAQQKAILGKSAWEAYSNNRLELRDLRGQTSHPVWGNIGFTRSLKEALASPSGVVDRVIVAVEEIAKPPTEPGGIRSHLLPESIARRADVKNRDMSEAVMSWTGGEQVDDLRAAASEIQRTGKLAADDDLSLDAAHILSQIDNGPVQTLHRGLSWDKIKDRRAIMTANVGTVLDIPISSFSKDPAVAETFVGQSIRYGGRAERNQVGLVITVRTNGWDISGHPDHAFPEQQEVITAGKFRIVELTRRTDKIKVRSEDGVDRGETIDNAWFNLILERIE